MNTISKPFSQPCEQDVPSHTTAHTALRLDTAQSLGAEIFPDTLILDKLFQITSTYWRSLHTNIEEIYHSVETSGRWQKQLAWEDKLAFFETGRFYVDKVIDKYTQLTGLDVKDAVCMDFGCGAGRLAVSTLEKCKHLYGVDFSENHLNETCNNVAIKGKAHQFTPVMLNNLGDLAKIPPFDLGYSFITLQHNTPPVIAAIVARLLTLLKPGGCAFLHIPLALPDYKFTVADYLSDEKSGKNMEIHVLPRNDLNDIADACGCDIVTSENIGGVDIAYSENLVFRKRVGTS